MGTIDLTRAPAGEGANSQIPCRLCLAPARRRFDLTVLRRHSVALYRCTRCASLQTEPPHWLSEAYADGRPVRDVWMASRTERMRALVLWTLRILGTPHARLFDWGGGNGLLVRMLRDAGVDAYLSDKYASNYYAVGFEVEPGASAEVMTAFEVFEHADDPRRLMAEMSAHAPEIILLSTDLYAGQGAEWSYLHADSGKHVFFYTRQGMRVLAEQFGYQCLAEQHFTLLHRRPLARAQVIALRLLLANFRRNRVCRLLATADALRGTRPGPNADYAALRTRGVI